MYSISALLKDTLLLISLRLKLLIKDKMTVVVYISALILFLIIFISLNEQAENNSSIPIGIVNFDYVNGEESQYSRELIENLKNLQAFNIYEDEMTSLEQLLSEGHINSLFVIEQGYALKVQKGDNKNLLTILHSSKSNLALFVSDIVAGEMMHQICIERSYSRYRRYANSSHSQMEYRAYAEELKKSKDIDFGFQITYLNSSPKLGNAENVNSGILYRQIIASIALVIFSFVILFVITQYVLEKENDIDKRRKVSLLGRMSMLLSDIISSVAAVSLLVVAFLAGFIYYNQDVSFTMIVSLTIGYCLITGFIYAVLGRIMKSMFWFQLIGSVFIIGSGIISFLSVLKGFGAPDFGILEDILPNVWFINEVTKLML